eukprot:GHRQ01029633.1.p1 GENE.GHRQ01029633.1~~GHRQ01029633.1.p1  ORF type:complete len:195 (-),score=16.98 GHRQ01029633.1:24-608(-)
MHDGESIMQRLEAVWLRTLLAPSSAGTLPASARLASLLNRHNGGGLDCALDIYPCKRRACLQVAAVHSVWQSLQAMLRINRFWGIMVFGWVPLVSLVTAFVTAITGLVYWYMTDSKSKKGLLGSQVRVMCLAGHGEASCMTAHLQDTVTWKLLDQPHCPQPHAHLCMPYMHGQRVRTRYVFFSKVILLNWASYW